MEWPQLIHHPQQWQMFTAPENGYDEIFVVAGRGSGKTEIAKRRLVLSLAEPKPHKHPRYFYAADTTPHAKEIAWESIIELMPSDWIVDALKGKGTIKTCFDSTLLFFGLHDGDRRSLPIEGKQWDGGVVDESSDCTPGVVDVSIKPALTWRNGWLYRIGVPKRHGIGASEFRKGWEAARTGQLPGKLGLGWPSSDLLPADRLRKLQETLDPKDYREQFEASWETSGGGIFWCFDEDIHVRPVSYSTNRPILVGCDFNVDPMAWVIGHASSNGINWFDELWLRDTNTPQALDILWNRYNDHKGGWMFIGDASSRARKTSANDSDYILIARDERFKNSPGGAEVAFPSANPAVEDRYASCNALFLNAAGEARMYVAPNCKHLIDDLKIRTRPQPGRKLPKNVGHITDAMGYPVHALFPVGVEIADESPEVIISQGPR